jgi:hypothetical protein
MYGQDPPLERAMSVTPPQSFLELGARFAEPYRHHVRAHREHLEERRANGRLRPNRHRMYDVPEWA